MTKRGSSNRSSGKSANGEETRARLVQSTVDLLETHSIIELAATDISTRAGLSNATFYVYFTDVYGALLAAGKAVCQSGPELLGLFDQPWTEATARSRAEQLVQGYFAVWDANRPVLRARNLAADEGLPEFFKQRQAAIQPLRSALERQIKLSQDGGRIPSSLDAFAVANALLALLERTGAVRSIYSEREFQWVAEYAQAVVQIILSGLGFAARR
jgi:AcrR family transcriptional regulator